MIMKLKKELNLLDVFCIATGAMISSGLFLLPGLAHARAGPAVVFSYFFAGLLAMTGMLSQAELVSAMPKAGGTYFYVTRSMGPAVGTIDGLITWFSLSLKSAFALLGMAAFTKLAIKIDIHIIAVCLCIIFIATNIVGIKEASRIQVGMVSGLLLILLFYIVKGIPSINIHNFEPFAPFGLSSVFSTAGFVFISFGGLLKVASIAEEVKNPAKTVPLGMILSLTIVTILYTLVVFVTSGVLGARVLDHSLTPVSDGASVFIGKKGMILMSFAAILAFVSTANAGIMASSRYPMALSKDRLIPDVFGETGKRFKTPHYSILLTGIFIITVLFLKLDILVKVASTVLILTFIFSCLSVIIMRESMLQNYDPKFKSPLYPWVQIVGIIGFPFLVIEMGIEALVVFSLLIVGGLFIYWFYGRIRTSREYALLHLIQRITAKELTTRFMETELKEIIRERDEISLDRFDRMIQECIILDINDEMGLEEFFHLAAKTLSPRLEIDESELFRNLLARENESSTVIGPGLAIPHVVIPGEKHFDILIVRNRLGIKFSDTSQNINTLFLLAGTKDERNFHLRALSAIAQICQERNFHKKWSDAKSIEGLRDIILLGKRMRK